MEGLYPENQYAHKEKLNISDPEEARDFVFAMIERGEVPCVSVPEEYLSALQKGLVAHASWIPGMNAIVGTLGRKPYMPNKENERRVVVRIKKINPQNIQPRFTGPDKAFHGVVVIDGPIPPENIEVAMGY